MILLVLLLILVAIQFLPIDRSVPDVDPSQDFVLSTQPPGEVAKLFHDACYDCHSYETEYPWYGYVAPVGQWLQGHINHGRGKVNYSIWTTYSADDQDHALKEMGEMIETRKMPLKGFVWMHPEAQLTDAQRADMVAWLSAVRGGRGGYTPK